MSAQWVQPNIFPANDCSYYITRNMLFMQWEAPVATIDIDIPNAGHIARETVTAQSKQHAFELMTSIAYFSGTRMCIRVYETAGGLRGFVTSHWISAAHLWCERAFAQHLLDSGQDPYFLIGCMATCKFTVRLSPKWTGEQPRENDIVAFYGLINDDVPEIPVSVRLVADLARIQDAFFGLDADQLIKALALFRSQNEAFFGAAPPIKPWSNMHGLYDDPDRVGNSKNRILVRDVQAWRRSVPIPDPSCGFMSGPPASEHSMTLDLPG